jgi:cell division septum initiation protein DivIVA
MVRDLQSLLGEKIAAYENLNQQTEKLLEENLSLKEQVQTFSTFLDSNGDIDSFGI